MTERGTPKIKAPPQAKIRPGRNRDKSNSSINDGGKEANFTVRKLTPSLHEPNPTKPKRRTVQQKPGTTPAPSLASPSPQPNRVPGARLPESSRHPPVIEKEVKQTRPRTKPNGPRGPRPRPQKQQLEGTTNANAQQLPVKPRLIDAFGSSSLDSDSLPSSDERGESETPPTSPELLPVSEKKLQGSSIVRRGRVRTGAGNKVRRDSTPRTPHSPDLGATTKEPGSPRPRISSSRGKLQGIDDTSSMPPQTEMVTAGRITGEEQQVRGAQGKVNSPLTQLKRRMEGRAETRVKEESNGIESPTQNQKKGRRPDFVDLKPQSADIFEIVDDEEVAVPSPKFRIKRKEIQGKTGTEEHPLSPPPPTKQASVKDDSQEKVQVKAQLEGTGLRRMAPVAKGKGNVHRRKRLVADKTIPKEDEEGDASDVVGLAQAMNALGPLGL